MLPPFSGKRIAISGGEPAVRRDCAQILEHCAVTCGHDVDLYTNGKRFPERLAKRVMEINEGPGGHVNIQMSLEGADAETNDRVRGQGSFDYAMKSLAMFMRLGLNRSTVLFVCITKDNIAQVDALIALAERFDVAALAFSQWQRQGNAAGTPWASIAPTTEEWVEAGEKLLAYDNPRLRVAGNFFGDLNNNEYGRFSLDRPLFPKHLYAYNAFPRIAPDGDVWADQLWVDKDWVLGNVADEDLADCFDKPKFYQQLADMRARIDSVSECQACEWRELCQGGSPGHTYAEYGHMNAKDLFCESRIYWFNRFVDHQVGQAFG
jgi:radical SAM protein with 4Fe4S-binding SPASM domain